MLHLYREKPDLRTNCTATALCLDVCWQQNSIWNYFTGLQPRQNSGGVLVDLCLDDVIVVCDDD